MLADVSANFNGSARFLTPLKQFSNIQICIEKHFKDALMHFNALI